MSCSLLGVFLVLRKVSMLTDAISHTVLLGIVLAFFIIPDLSSPFLVLGASAMGFLTVFLVEILGSKGVSKYDEAIGVVFPILFSAAIILINIFFRNVHLDSDMVLDGEVLFASLVKIDILGFKLTQAIFYQVILLIVILIFIISQFKKLQISTFDSEFAYLIGVPTTLIFYMLMAFTSLSAVTSFTSVGAILVISFFIGPSSTALLFSKTLKQTLIFSSLIGSINAAIGFYLALSLNVSIAGTVAAVNMLVYLVLLSIKKYTIVNKLNKKVNASKDMVVNENFKSTKRRISNNNI
ncbi:metal ABC transporter permease [Anaerococcus sp. ENR0831]|uniref:Metal ABC transporter permease n=1 Tax=Anaerococcus martiniensis TaxID=3115615 RepID=A0ABW9M8G1_9FIRM